MISKSTGNIRNEAKNKKKLKAECSAKNNIIKDCKRGYNNPIPANILIEDKKDGNARKK